MGINSLPARRWGQIGLVALLGLTLALVTVNAGHANAGHAVEAKKKCKKKKHRSASSAKKKCKKKKQPVVPPVTTPTPPSTPTPQPTTRASITWNDDSEVDLHVYDASGNHAFWDDSFGIPNADEEDQSSDGGPETFTDLLDPSTRTFSFYVCLFEYGDSPDPSGDVEVTADITDPGGGHRSVPITLNGIGDEELVTVSPSTGTTFTPDPGFCGVMV